ncbi:MAG TPA: hypothetical protein PKY77_12195 [Phycisphaerae bacterium]|nr:hypothetical protein [Phycisphaerae bacterium]HRY70427.1 hypothetical protein [Phycisphaerae bacterium]HSA28144.1 hypothetical protein [Phycisphaerae bacterium]
MCESCSSPGLDRREFLAAASALGAFGLTSKAVVGEPAATLTLPLARKEKPPARVLIAFLYPPADVVNEGKMEDSWRVHNWFTWPGNQFEPEQQEGKFAAQIRAIAEKIGMTVEFHPNAIYQEAKVKEFIERAKAARPDAVLIVNFWNTFSKWSFQMATESAVPTAIVYQPVGSNHQLPPEYLRNAEGLCYIHAIENWDEIERGLRAVRARKMLAQSRLLRISGRAKSPIQTREQQLEVDILEAPAEEFNAMFDSIAADASLVREGQQVRKNAERVMDVTDEYFVEAMRAHRAVARIMERYGADAITIECLQLKHRKPCISFATNNGALVPCGCENDLNATLTLMLGQSLLDRAGFQHNPEFDTSENHYFASHCTCAWKLHGPQGASQPYLVRPFFHQLPKTPALDVQWTPGEPVMVAKYLSGQDQLCCWTGKVIASPTSPPVGGCATRVLMEIDGVDDVCNIYSGPHPILFCGDRGQARCFRAFARMYRLRLEGNL